MSGIVLSYVIIARKKEAFSLLPKILVDLTWGRAVSGSGREKFCNLMCDSVHSVTFR